MSELGFNYKYDANAERERKRKERKAIFDQAMGMVTKGIITMPEADQWVRTGKMPTQRVTGQEEVITPARTESTQLPTSDPYQQRLGLEKTPESPTLAIDQIIPEQKRMRDITAPITAPIKEKEKKPEGVYLIDAKNKRAFTSYIDENGNPQTKTLSLMNVPAGAKTAPLESIASSREHYIEQRGELYDRSQFKELISKVNSLDRNSRNAVGIAGLNNMRADRVLNVIDKPNVTNQDIANFVADIAGIYKGGVPDQIQMEHSNYDTLVADLTHYAQYLASNPLEVPTKEVKDHLKEITKEIKDVDNQVIYDNIGIQEIAFAPLLSKPEYRKQWEMAIGLVKKTTVPLGERPKVTDKNKSLKDKYGLE